MGEYFKIISNNDYLEHYGVLGMKWGMRKDPNYTYKSMGQRKWEKRLQRAKQGNNQQKIYKAQRKLSVYKTRDRNRQNYAKNASVGGRLAVGTGMTLAGAASAAIPLLAAGPAVAAGAAAAGALYGATASYVGAGGYNRSRASGKSVVQSLMSSTDIFNTKFSEVASAKAEVGKGNTKDFYKMKK